ncbi:MAG: single-stranded DNA-binding protein, partial [Bacteroidales bacterium]|nr:single-stranded DNA-binding protein [Bacteroidales bacterium]
GELRENTEWHNIVAWRNSADVAEKFIRKGTQVYIEGKLRTRSWTDQTGNKRYTTEVAVDNLQLLGKRNDNPGAQSFGSAQSLGSAQEPRADGYQQAPQQPAQYPAGERSRTTGPSTPVGEPSRTTGTGYPQPQQPAYQQPQNPPQQPIDIGIDDNPSDDLPF